MAKEIENIVVSNFSRDLMQRLVSAKHFAGKFEDPSEDTEYIELSPGLSMNGQFGVDSRAKKQPKHSKRYIRHLLCSRIREKGRERRDRLRGRDDHEYEQFFLTTMNRHKFFLVKLQFINCQ